MKKPEKQKRQHSAGELTLLLSHMENPETLGRVMRMTYDHLRALAGDVSRAEWSARSWQPSDLLNETCIRLMTGQNSFKNTRHFFGAATRTMRRLLVDKARQRKAQKRGGPWHRVVLGIGDDIGFEPSNDFLDFDTALSRLEKIQPKWSEVAELRMVGGWTFVEIAYILGIADSTARRRWDFAKRCLRQSLAAYAVTPATSRVTKRIGANP